MLYVLCLMHGAMLGQASMPAAAPASSPGVTFLQPLAADSVPSNEPNGAATGTIILAAPTFETADDATAEKPTETTAEPSPFSIFSRPCLADRSALSFVFGSGPGRFNIIDWESRPNSDRYWGLACWSVPEDVQLHAGLGFNIHWWSGPVQNGSDPPPNLPPQVFDLYVDVIWSQRWSERLTSEIRFRPGLYTDFRTTPPDSFRVPGKAVSVYQVNPRLHLVGGVEYLQRNDIQLLPVAGVLWQPTPRWQIGMVFPEPKIAFALSTRQHLWGYVAGEYGGGRWTYRNDVGQSDRVEYSDFRVMFGIEWREDPSCTWPAAPHPSAFLEVGYVFERHLRFTNPTAQFEPEPAWMIRFGSAW